MRRLWVAGMAALFMGIGTAQVASAQACTLSMTTCSLNAHAMHGGTQYGGNGHGTCNACLEYGIEVGGYVCHSCDASDLSESQKLAYRAVLKAASIGDINEVLRLALKAPGMVTYNAKRNAVQISSCTKKEIVGSLPLTTSAQLRVAVGLQSSTIRVAVQH